jgi:DNA helicase-2/ATP-dependent DNA helicase PcrA
METIADLHIHSRYSIATGKQSDLEHLDLWGRYKGLQVVGTGDCTHPVWLQEMAAKLEPVASGTYVLKPNLSLPLGLKGPAWQEVSPVRFVISGEVSAIYRKNGRVRKVHLLLLLPSLEAAEKLSQRLARLGNVASDGRPILGLDAKYLLELVLEIDPQSLVIPAHIWTPWFSVLGSKSGFDSLEECFEDGLDQIYALETGLSSDPAMNWRVAALDRFLLVSNSDAHSPQKLGREANLFTVPPTYPDLAQAIRSKNGFAGTLEFFPQEGKYHLDGHRHCGLRLNPEEAARLGGLCPKCGKPLTYGVLHRVQDLANRSAGEAPPGAKPYESLIALPEILAEVWQTNPGSKKLQARYFRLLENLGPELNLLRRVALEVLAREGNGLLAHALDKMRRGAVHIDGGYDGEYGEVRLFTLDERRRLQGQAAFFSLHAGAPTTATSQVHEPTPLFDLVSPQDEVPAKNEKRKTKNDFSGDPLLAPLNRAQRQAVTYKGPALIVAAGPGTGKTRALTHRLAYLVSRRGVPPQEILAVTFTRQAAGEMAGRLQVLLPDFPGLDRLTLKTFHALGHQILTAAASGDRQVATEEQRRHLLREAARDHHLPFPALEKRVTAWKQALLSPEELTVRADCEDPANLAAFRSYEAALAAAKLWDYEDLIARPTLLLETDPALREAYRGRFRHLLVDECQDLNEAQYRLFRLLASPAAEIMVIGDPDQAIYGFRGASPAYFSRFRRDWPEAKVIYLDETYRLPEPILQVAQHLRTGGEAAPLPMLTHQPGNRPLILLEAATPEAEARCIAKEINRLLGGLSHLALEDQGLRHQGPEDRASFRDIAVLYRLHALGPELERVLQEVGIPCQQPREGVGPEWDGLDLAAERVKLLSLHAAKGLEFPYVFIAGCEEGLIPWEPPGEMAADLAEERRLFYVGITRASRQVFLTRARERQLWGQKRCPALSPYVRDLPAELLHRPESPAFSRSQRQRSLFPEMAPHRGKKAG